MSGGGFSAPPGLPGSLPLAGRSRSVICSTRRMQPAGRADRFRGVSKEESPFLHRTPAAPDPRDQGGGSCGWRDAAVGGLLPVDRQADRASVAVAVEDVAVAPAEEVKIAGHLDVVPAVLLDEIDLPLLPPLQRL